MRHAAGGRCSVGGGRCSGGERLSAHPPPLPEEVSGALRATEDEKELSWSESSRGGACARVWSHSQKTADDEDSTDGRSSLMSRSSIGVPTGIDGRPSVHRHTSIELSETSEPRPQPPPLPPWRMPPVAPLPRPGSGKARRDASVDERNSLVSAQL